MSKSIRQTDEFFNSSKQSTRQNNISVVEQSNLIIDNKLCCSWCEIMGASGMETLTILEEKELLNPGSFIGIDLDKDRISNFRSQRPDLQWFANNIFDILPQLNDVGVLNLDIYGKVGYDKDYYDLSLIKVLITKSIKKLGEFILFYNKDLDATARQKIKRGDALRYHSDRICEVFKDYLPNRQFDSLNLLPKNAEEKIENGFVGQIGAYEIYKGKTNGHRMANLRIIFR